MILRKTVSVFLRTLRAIPSDTLPPLPEKKLSSARQKRLETAVFSRIAAEQSRSVFETSAQADFSAQADMSPQADISEQIKDFDRFDAPYESTPIGGRDAWKGILKIAVTACLCFALLASIVIVGGRLARLTGTGQTTDTADNSHISGTEAIWREPQETGVVPPYESAEGLSLSVTNVDVGNGSMHLSVQLTTDQPMKGIAVQYYRVILTRWNPETEQHEMLYDIYTAPDPKEMVLAGEIHFPLAGLGETNTVSSDITIYGNYSELKGLFHVVIEDLTLVSDSPNNTPTNSPENSLIAVSLTDDKVVGSFVIPLNGTPVEAPPEQNTLPLDVSEQYSLSVTETQVRGDTVTLHMNLNSSDGLPVGYGIFFEYCDIEIWNDEKQVWQGKFGTDDSGMDFVDMVLAGDMHFSLVSDTDGKDVNAFAVMPYRLPDDGWYRITLRGLVLVREAREGEEAEWNLVCEPLDDGAVYAVFHKE